MRRRFLIMPFLFAVVLNLQAQAPRAGSAACDRACLAGFITNYLNALVAHKPEILPVSGRVRFTEDTKEMKLGDMLQGAPSGWDVK